MEHVTSSAWLCDFNFCLVWHVCSCNNDANELARCERVTVVLLLWQWIVIRPQCLTVPVALVRSVFRWSRFVMATTTAVNWSMKHHSSAPTTVSPDLSLYQPRLLATSLSLLLLSSIISVMMRLLLDVSICFCPTPEPLLVVLSTSLLPYLHDCPSISSVVFLGFFSRWYSSVMAKFH